ncbi:DUF4178 domain-containing protein [Zavarzinia sp.]|uniref:DUF4178 domain-containing protein n=1 Tax=Zavarzinia sp. TaxID=2027920 RepID=UPI003BB52774|nr:DUF4178 domain-containing protein [Zavarzinia sp.]
MISFPCPACGAEVPFRGSHSVYAVCAYCGSMIVRRDAKIERIGKMAGLAPDMSPFQIGSICSWDERDFTLVGRLKVGWADGQWSEWYALADDGSDAWLAEAQGTYAFSRDEPLPRDDYAGEVLRALDAYVRAGAGKGQRNPLGESFRYAGGVLKIVDLRPVTCLGSEGELPFAAPEGRKAWSVDLLGPRGEFGCIELGSGPTRFFAGRYLDWDALQARNLRVLEGWS